MPEASRRGPRAACDECRDLGSHAFRSADDMLHAVQVAAAEVDRGALRRIEARELTSPEEEALASAFASDALPGALGERGECTVCGDRFELEAIADGGIRGPDVTGRQHSDQRRRQAAQKVTDGHDPVRRDARQAGRFRAAPNA